jgi:hypothetical protein
MDLKPPYLVIALRNANKHFWRRCQGGRRLKNLVGHDHDHMHVMVSIPIVDENRIVYDRLQPARNYTDNPEAFLRNNMSHIASSSATPPIVELVTAAPSATTTMAKTLCDYSTPAVANVPIGPAVNTGVGNFELRTSLIMTVQANQFCGLPNKDASAHLQHFLELCDTIAIKDVIPASIRLSLFLFSLAGKAKQWFYKEKEAISTWDKCSAAFHEFFPMGKTNALRGKILNFQQTSMESIPEAWERLQDYIQACPHHGMEN